MSARRSIRASKIEGLALRHGRVRVFPDGVVFCEDYIIRPSFGQPGLEPAWVATAVYDIEDPEELDR